MKYFVRIVFLIISSLSINTSLLAQGNSNQQIQISVKTGTTVDHTIANYGLSASSFKWELTNFAQDGTVKCVKTDANNTMATTVTYTILAGRFICKFDLNIFSQCGNWVVYSDTIQLKLTIDEPLSPFHGTEAVFRFQAQGTHNWVNVAEGRYNGILLELPEANITVPDVVLCKGETTKTVKATVGSAPTGWTIEWPAGFTAAAAVDNTQEATIGASVTSGTYTANLKDNTGTVVATTTFKVTVNELPAVTITPTAVCEGVEMQYRANASNIKAYQWGEAASGTNQISNKLTLTSASANKKVSVEVTDNNDCKNTATLTVTVNKAPKINLTADASDVCKGTDVVLTATPSTGNTFDWGSGTFGTASTSTKTVADLGNNKYTVKVKDGNGCIGTAEVNVTGHEMVLTLTPAKTTVNVGESTSITANVTYNPGPEAAAGTESYAWQKGTTAMSETTASINTGALSVPTKFTTTVSDGKYNCPDATKDVTINVTGEALAVNPTGGEGCEGSVIKLNAGVSGGKTPYTIKWIPSAGLVLSSNSVEQPTVDAATPAGTYTATVEVTDALGTVKTSEPVTIKVVAKPTITNISANPTTVAMGGNSDLEVQVTPTTAQVTWSGGTLSSTTGTRVTAQNIRTATTYTATATITDGATTCRDEKTVQVTVGGEALAVNPTGGEGCEGSVIKLNAGISGGKTPYTVKWIPSAGLVLSSNSVEQPTVAASTPAGTYTATVEVTDAAGTVKTSAPVTIKVVAKPTITNISATPTTVAMGGNSDLEVQVTPATAQVTWSGGMLSSTTGTRVTAQNIGTATTYTATATITDGATTCRDEKTVQVTVGGEALAVNPTGGEGCEGSVIKLNAGVSGGKTPYTIKWIPSAGLVLSSNSVEQPTVDAATPAGTYTATVEVTDAAGTVKTSAPVTIKVVAKPTITNISATPTTVAMGGNSDLEVQVTPATAQVTWSGGMLSSTTGTRVTAQNIRTATTYTATATITDGATTCRDEKTVQVTVGGEALAVNPTGGEGCEGSVIKLNAGVSGGKTPYTIKWMPSAGLVLSSNSVEQPTVDAATPAGTYTATVEVTDAAGTVKTSAPVTIKVVAKPTITNISATPTTVVMGNNSELEVQVTPATTQVRWSGGMLSSTTGTRVTAQNIRTATTYTATATVTDGATTCSDDKTVQVTVTEQPTLTWTMTEQICANPGNTRQIMLTARGGGVGATYSFVVSAPDGTAAKTVTNDANNSWTVTVDAANGGDYVISRFSATAEGVTTNGVVLPSQTIKVEFWPVPTVFANGVTHNSTLQHCEGVPLVLSGSGGEAGTTYTWNNGVNNGQPFVPPLTTTTYTVTGRTPHNCVGMDQVTVVVNPKPNITVGSDQEICVNEPVTLTGSSMGGANITWNNGVQNNVSFYPTLTSVYIATATDPTTGCTSSDSVTVVVNQAPEIVSASRNPRNIAIGKDVAFSIKATGKNLTYQWQKKTNGVWTNMTNMTNMTPLISGATSDSLVLKQVPRDWDGSEFKCIVTGDCGVTESEIFRLGVKECFGIRIELFMEDGIIPDDVPGNEIDGWYCIGTKIALRALITSDEGYEIENPHYIWTIDGLPAGPKVFESDSSVITWIPEYYEDDIVVKVCGYSDGACEDVCAHYLRLKARRFEDVSLKLLTSVDPEHAFCPGDTVTCWVETANAGDSVRFNWYNDIFNLPEELSPKNELIHYANNKITLKMGQEDTWVKVFMTPSKEVCTDQKVFLDTVFLRKKHEVQPWLKIVNNIQDTVACQGDRILFTAEYGNAGANPKFEWRKDIWDWGYERQVEAALEDKDMWMRCKMTPGKDVCYSGGLLIDTMVVRVLELSKVTIWTDLTNKQPGDEIVVESEVENMPTQAHYEWYVNTYMANAYEAEYVSDKLTQGDVIVCAVRGERICQNRVFSNELEINFGKSSRDTTIIIYAGERIQNLDLKIPGDTEDMVFEIVDNGQATLGMSSLSYDGIFNYIPNVSLGADRVRYKVYNKYNKDKMETGNVYIKIMDRSHFFIPNIITPNGDGLNDTWRLEFLADYPDHLITVYNRNGKVVFQAKNYNSDWDGSGQTTSSYVSHFNLSNGIYTYVIDLGNKQILKNWLEIRRDMNRGKYKY